MLWKHSRMIKHSNRLSKDNRGVTLIEMIAMIAVLSVVIATVTGFMISGAKMSATVSGTAKNSIKDQTAVEYINRWIWDASVLQPSEPYVYNEETRLEFMEDGKTYYTILSWIESDEKTAILTSSEGLVTYRVVGSAQIELCTGEIYFECLSDSTLAYYLNGERHVVHLRAGEVITESESEIPEPAENSIN